MFTHCRFYAKDKQRVHLTVLPDIPARRFSSLPEPISAGICAAEGGNYLSAGYWWRSGDLGAIRRFSQRNRRDEMFNARRVVRASLEEDTKVFRRVEGITLTWVEVLVVVTLYITAMVSLLLIFELIKPSLYLF
ncbi:unnamed protein product, partial [Mesorhabditis spiculigera]